MTKKETRLAKILAEACGALERNGGEQALAIASRARKEIESIKVPSGVRDLEEAEEAGNDFLTLQVLQRAPGIEGCMHQIEVRLLVGDGELEVGALTGYLVNLSVMDEAGIDKESLYDGESDDLADAYRELFGEDGRLREDVTGALDYGDLAEMTFWHLHLERLHIPPQYRGRRYGAKSLGILRGALARHGMIATLHAFPVGDGRRDEGSADKLTAYYLSDARAEFRQVPDRPNWLVADWSSPLPGLGMAAFDLDDILGDE